MQAVFQLGPRILCAGPGCPVRAPDKISGPEGGHHSAPGLITLFMERLPLKEPEVWAG